MTGLIVAGYMGIGLIAGYIFMKIGDKKIREGVDGSEDVANKAGQMIDAIGYKNFMIIVYILFAMFWFPVIIWVLLKKLVTK